MAEDMLPLLGVNIGGHEEGSSDSDNETQNMEVDNQKESLKDGQEKKETSTTDKKKKEKNKEKMTFDPSLPGTHSYLGDDLEDISGRTVHEDESFIELPVLTFNGVVLIPGQTLPLQLFEPATVAMIRNIVRGDKTFGLVTIWYNTDSSGSTTASLPTIGTTAEIFSFKEESDEATGIATVRVKAMGRQRFSIEETRRSIDGILMAKVRIMPEKVLPSPLEGALPHSYEKFFCSKKQSTDAIESSTTDTAAVLKNFFTSHKKVPQRKNMPNRFSSAYQTWWPPWVYKLYDAHCVMKRVKKELCSWNESLDHQNLPQDPADFSFWLAGNLPLDDTLKLHLLSIHSAVQRLRCELSIMQRCAVLCCKNCGNLIANKKDVFSMAVEGPMAAYVNPGGHVHETFTVSKAKGLSSVGRPSTEHSWFPGYAWTIVQCNNCHLHMGWKFTVASKKHLKPTKFWGLCRSSLLPRLQHSGTDDEEFSEQWRPMY